MKNIPWRYIFGLLILWSCSARAQDTTGIITVPHTDSIYNSMLDPDGDGYITESGTEFTSGTTERAEFEVIPTSVSGWFEVPDYGEVDSDITPNCGNPDLIQDADGGDFAFYNIIDPTPATPANGDEYILFRFRLAQPPNGNFGYNFLVDTDGAFGAGSDPNATCGNAGFEREVQFANAGGKSGVSVYNVDGTTTFTSTLCSSCIKVDDVQQARAASSGNCGKPDPQFITVPLPLSYLGISSDINPATLYIMVATASSGNAISVLGGGNVTDLGALNAKTDDCGCAAQSGCGEFDCQSNCLNSNFVSLPISFTYFTAESAASGIGLRWKTESEVANGDLQLEHSTDGISFTPLGFIYGKGATPTAGYNFVHRRPTVGTNYYRLKQVDYDGFHRFSTIRAVQFGESTSTEFVVFPTIVTDGQLRLKLLRGDTDASLAVTVTDHLGRQLIRQQFRGQDLVHLPVGTLPPGPYLIQLNDGRTVSTERFVKR
ncbi:hypothetical protein GGR28_001427 [Lewinella aquimaris]|uniref:T9SS type A sorting domain-containing protein n=1 Tax=Neolewinella aquimaris TaxID=1835722 RepID=A0A840E108_9BACT|nr:T9SS type A sorting domain-containing protein [Neolewinella aquimaris]MBB4078810.1 hypothetical protein [Neolewinella aquimaris]